MVLFDIDVLKDLAVLFLLGFILGTLSDQTASYSFFCVSFNVQKNKKGIEYHCKIAVVQRYRCTEVKD